MNIYDHEHKALMTWLKHYDECALELGLGLDSQERHWAAESFCDGMQLKLLDDGCIKVKWEHPCWWADCKHPVFHGQYYCVLAHPKDVVWKEPFVLAKEEANAAALEMLQNIKDEEE